jgi:hypothetical protein
MCWIIFKQCEEKKYNILLEKENFKTNY